MGWALEFITLTTHSGTHLDAPYHYHPTMDKGRRSLTIDEIPLEWCFGNGVVLDFSHKGDGERISAAELKRELERISMRLASGYRSHPNRCGCSLGHFCLSHERGGDGPGEHLVPHRKRGKGDWNRCLELGPASPFLAKEFKETGDPRVIWEAHFAGIEIGYCHMEKLANLAAIGRPHGFTVCCFPINIKKASAGWVRPIAISEEELTDTLIGGDEDEERIV